MNVTNIEKAKDWFEVLQTSGRSQTAIMESKNPVIICEATRFFVGEGVAFPREADSFPYRNDKDVGDERPTLKKGDVIIIPVGEKHRFTNRTQNRAVTFNVYSPPTYPAG